MLYAYLGLPCSLLPLKVNCVLCPRSLILFFINTHSLFKYSFIPVYFFNNVGRRCSSISIDRLIFFNCMQQLHFTSTYPPTQKVLEYLAEYASIPHLKKALSGPFHKYYKIRLRGHSQFDLSYLGFYSR